MTALRSVPLEDVLRDVLSGVELIEGLQLEDLTPRRMSLVIIRIQQMRRAKVEDFQRLTVALGEAKKEATLVEAAAFLACPGPQDERRQVGKKAAAEAVFEVDKIKGELQACEKAMEVLKDDWDSCRSIGANERAERNALEGIGA